MKNIVSWFPDAKIIHLVRDPRDVVLSMRKNFTRPPLTGFPDRRRKMVTDVVGGAKLWVEGEQLMEAGLKWIAPANYLKINYSDLVNLSENTLKQVCNFLQIEFEPHHMLSFYQKNKEEQLISERRLRIHQQTLQPVSNQRENLYKKELTPLEILTVNYICTYFLKKHGFEFQQPSLFQFPIIWMKIAWYHLKYGGVMLQIYIRRYFFSKN